jgi:hypothetical protein
VWRVGEYGPELFNKLSIEYIDNLVVRASGQFFKDNSLFDSNLVFPQHKFLKIDLFFKFPYYFQVSRGETLKSHARSTNSLERFLQVFYGGGLIHAAVGQLGG